MAWKLARWSDYLTGVKMQPAPFWGQPEVPRTASAYRLWPVGVAPESESQSGVGSPGCLRASDPTTPLFYVAQLLCGSVLAPKETLRSPGQPVLQPERTTPCRPR